MLGTTRETHVRKMGATAIQSFSETFMANRQNALFWMLVEFMEAEIELVIQVVAVFELRKRCGLPMAHSCFFHPLGSAAAGRSSPGLVHTARCWQRCPAEELLGGRRCTLVGLKSKLHGKSLRCVNRILSLPLPSFSFGCEDARVGWVSSECGGAAAATRRFGVSFIFVSAASGSTHSEQPSARVTFGCTPPLFSSMPASSGL